MATIRQIAREAGCSPTTVSRVLRGERYVSAEVKQQVTEAAERLGYRRNPLVGAFLADIRTRKKRNRSCNLCWMQVGPFGQSYLDNYVRGACARAESLGYAMDRISLAEEKFTSGEQILRVLASRGIEGVAVRGDARTFGFLRESTNLAVVGIERYDFSLPIHRVAHADFQNLLLAFKKLRECGCKRIGLFLNTFVDENTGHQFVGSWSVCQQMVAEHERVPPLVIVQDSKKTYEVLGSYLSRERLDGVIVHFSEVLPALKQLGIKVPQDVQVAHLNLADDVRSWSGIDPMNSEVGSMAVELLASAVEKNERGFPEHPHEMIVAGRWIDAETTRPRG